MKNILITAILIAFLSANLFAAKNIILQRGEQSFAYETIAEAVNASITGDIMYLPSGNFDVTGLKFNKGIHIIGAGYHPVTTGATGQTTISGPLVFITGADGGSIQGLNITNYVRFGADESNSEVHNFTIKRCYIAGALYLGDSWNAVTKGSDFTITENIIMYGICGGYANNLILSNNIIDQIDATFRPLTMLKNAIISNNIIITNDSYTSNSVISCTFKNNVITLGNLYYVNEYSNNIYLNNLHCYPTGLNTNGVTQNEGNVFIERNKMFVNQAEESFNFSQDYHLTQDALNAITGTDGTQVGIYGGDYPFKEGAAPINPQIIEKKISSATNPKGNLKVEIKVEAQNK